jgi:hypothetical protein
MGYPEVMLRNKLFNYAGQKSASGKLSQQVAAGCMIHCCRNNRKGLLAGRGDIRLLPLFFALRVKLGKCGDRAAKVPAKSLDLRISVMRAA